MAEQGTSRSGSVDALAALATAQRLAAGVVTIRYERELLENAAKEFAQLFRADYVGMLMSERDGSGRIIGEHPASTQLDGLVMSPDVRLISEKVAKVQIAVLENISDSVLLSQKARESLLQAKLNALTTLPMGDQDGRWIGAIVLGFQSELALDVATIDTAMMLARQVGSYVLGVRQVERTSQQVAQFTALLTLSQTLASIENEKDLGYEVAKVIPSLLSLTQFTVLRGDPRAQSLELTARWETGTAQKTQQEQPVSVNVTGTLISQIGQTDDTVDIPDFSAEKPAIQGLFQMPTHSGLAAPLRAGERQIGAIVIESDHIFAYNEADKVIFNQLVMQMNGALTRMNASTDMMRSATSSNAVNTVSQQIQGETSAQGVLRGGTLATLNALKAVRVSTRLGNPDTNLNGSNGTEKTRG